MFDQKLLDPFLVVAYRPIELFVAHFRTLLNPWVYPRRIQLRPELRSGDDVGPQTGHIGQPGGIERQQARLEPVVFQPIRDRRVRQAPFTRVATRGDRRDVCPDAEVDQLLRGNDRSWKPGLPLYGASLGPDGDGDVRQTVDLFVPPGDFDDLGARAWIGDEPAPCSGRGSNAVTTCCRRSTAISARWKRIRPCRRVTLFTNGLTR